MGQSFDPYYKWLGIPPEEQPANHYRLLGIKTFESDPDVIEAAADQRMSHLRTYQTGKFSAFSQRLLNEVAGAKICLLNPAKRAVYDTQLQQKLASPPAIPLELMLEPASPPVSAALRSKRLPMGAIIAAAVSLAALVVAGLGYWNVVLKKQAAEVAKRDEAGAKIAVKTPKTPAAGARVKKDAKVEEKETSAASAGEKAFEKAAQTQPEAPVAKPAVEGESKSARTALIIRSDNVGRVDSASEKAKIISADSSKTQPVTEGAVGAVVKGGEAEKSKDIEAGKKGDEQTPQLLTAAEQEEALKAARESHKEELSKARTPEERAALAEKLLTWAGKLGKEDATALGVLCLASDVSISAADGKKAMAAIDAMGGRYRLNVFAMKADALSGCAKKAHTQPQHVEVANQAMALIANAGKENREQAIALARLAEAEGRRGGNAEMVRRAGELAVELRKKPPKGEASKPRIRPLVQGKWCSLLPLQDELVGWEPENCRFSYENGVIELRGRDMYCPIAVKDATVRAKVKRHTPSCVRLILRDGEKGCYIAQLTSGNWSIIKVTRRSTGARNVVRGSGDQDILVSIPVVQSHAPDVPFEMGFSAIGEELTIFLNGQVVLQTRDTAIADGVVGIGTDNSSGLFLTDVEVLIPKGSLIADQRNAPKR